VRTRLRGSDRGSRRAAAGEGQPRHHLPGGAAARPAKVDDLYYLRKPDKLHHFFTADADEFCRKAREYGYGC